MTTRAFPRYLFFPRAFLSSLSSSQPSAPSPPSPRQEARQTARMWRQKCGAFKGLRSVFYIKRNWAMTIRCSMQNKLTQEKMDRVMPLMNYNLCCFLALSYLDAVGLTINDNTYVWKPKCNSFLYRHENNNNTYIPWRLVSMIFKFLSYLIKRHYNYSRRFFAL